MPPSLVLNVREQRAHPQSDKSERENAAGERADKTAGQGRSKLARTTERANKVAGQGRSKLARTTERAEGAGADKRASVTEPVAVTEGDKESVAAGSPLTEFERMKESWAEDDRAHKAYLLRAEAYREEMRATGLRIDASFQKQMKLMDSMSAIVADLRMLWRCKSGG